YELLVGKLNRCAALVALGQGNGIEAAIEVLEQANRENHVRIATNAQMILAQAYLLDRQPQAAREILSAAAEGSPRSLDDVLLRKWQVLSEWMNRPRKDFVLRMESLARQAARSGYWEAARDAYLLSAIMRKSRPAIARVFYGTPFLEYRERARRMIQL